MHALRTKVMRADGESCIDRPQLEVQREKLRRMLPLPTPAAEPEPSWSSLLIRRRRGGRGRGRGRGRCGASGSPGTLNSDGQNLLVYGKQFGNVFIGVQPSFGYEGADLHFGTHGSLEIRRAGMSAPA